MSRYTIQNEENNTQLSYGWDHALGYYYDIVDLNQEEESGKFIVEEKSSSFDNLSRKEFNQVLDDWEAPREHLLAVALDQPF